MSDENTPDAGKLRTFSQLVAQIAGGDLHDRLSRAVTDLMGDIQNAAHEGGKPKGRITLTLDFGLDGRMVRVVPAMKVDAPKPAAMESTHLFVSPDNTLTLTDPKQLKLPLRDVTATPAATAVVVN